MENFPDKIQKFIGFIVTWLEAKGNDDRKYYLYYVKQGFFYIGCAYLLSFILQNDGWGISITLVLILFSFLPLILQRIKIIDLSGDEILYVYRCEVIIFVKILISLNVPLAFIVTVFLVILEIKFDREDNASFDSDTGVDEPEQQI